MLDWKINKLLVNLDNFTRLSDGISRAREALGDVF